MSAATDHVLPGRSLLFTSCLLLLFSTSGLAADQGVHGRVLGLDETGQSTGPVVGATVTLLNLSGAVAAETHSVEGGYYRLEATPGRYTFKVVADGYKDEDEGRGIELQLSDRYAVFNFSLAKGQTDPKRKRPDLATTGVGQLSGHVLWKTEGQFPDGVAGAVISLKGPDNAHMLVKIVSRSEKRKTSELAGGYDVTLAAGKWRASVVAPGFETLIEETPIEIIADNKVRRNFLLQKKVPPEIRNQGIRVRLMHTDVFSGDEIPPPSQVYIISQLRPNHPGNPLKPGGPGFFERNLPVGLYRAVVMGERYQTAWSAPVEVFRGRYTLIDLKLTLQREARPLPDVLESHGIRGIVKVADPVATPDNLGVDAILQATKVYIVSSNGDSTLTNPLRLDPEGQFSRALPIGGPYRVIAIARGYEPVGVEASVAPDAFSEVELTLRKRIEATPLPMGLVLNAAVFGQAAEGAQKYPLSDASVLLRRPGETLSEAPRATTDEKGLVHFDLVTPGPHAVLAQKEGYLPRGARVTISETEPNTIEVTLLQKDSETMPVRPTPTPALEPITMSGFVVTRDPKEPTGIRGLPKSLLRWIPTGGDPAGVKEFTALQSGRFEIEMTPGRYEFDIHPPPGTQNVLKGTSEKVTIVAGMPTKYFYLSPFNNFGVRPESPSPSGKVNVRGYVVTESGGRFVPVSLAQLTFSKGLGGALRPLTSGQSGKFSVVLDAGDYNVAIRAPAGFVNTNEQLFVKPGMEPHYFVLRRPVAGPVGPGTGLAALDIRVLEPLPPRPPRLLPGATVTMLQDNMVAARSNTDTKGRASFRIKPGSYEIQTALNGFITDSGAMNLSSGRVSHDIYLRRTSPGPGTMPSPGTLNVQVGTIDSRSGNKVQLLSGAHVGITQDGVPVAAGTTNRVGVYTARLKPGIYQVSASYQLLKTEQSVVQVTSGVRDYRILLKPASTPTPQNVTTLKIQVGGVHPKGGNQIHLLSNVRVSVKQGNRTVASGVTDRNGNYTGNLTPGTYGVEAQISGYYDGKVTVEAGEGTVEKRILLKPKTIIK